MEGQFTWSDGSHLHFTNWTKRHRSGHVNHNGDCVSLEREGWKDVYCFTSLSYVCKKTSKDRTIKLKGADHLILGGGGCGEFGRFDQCKECLLH